MSTYGLRGWVVRLFQIYRYYRNTGHAHPISCREAWRFAGDPYWPEE
jgi:hypothetical protein